MAATSAYRRDIDGLRAVAIIPVVLYHLKFRYVPGGFIGVDIFFVISGYLITQHILSELNTGRFSIASFYERRVRRIVPALFVMLAVTSAVAYRFLLPIEMIDFARSLISALLSVSNIYFWLHTNYFEVSDKPLVHTWSLGVEEQFYAVVPIALLLLHRYWRNRLRLVVVVTAAASFVLSVFLVLKFPSATFYLLPTRAWELLVGSILAFDILPRWEGRLLREAGALLALLCVLALSMALSNTVPFPGATALLPCLAAALMIETGKRGTTLVSRLLSTKPMVAIGLISYSVYLWHLPIIVFLDYVPSIRFGLLFSRIFPFLSGPQAVTVERITLVVGLSTLLGALSWRFVEQPMRFGRFRPRRIPLFATAATAAVLLLAWGQAAKVAKGFPARFSPNVVAIASFNEANAHYREGSCFVGNIREYNQSECLKEDPEKPNWLLFGDSHAAQMYFGLAQRFPEINFLQWTLHGCKPVPVFRYGENHVCYEAVRDFYRDYLPAHHFSGIILAANWQPYDLPRLNPALNLLKNDDHQHVVLIGPIMHYDEPLARLLAEGVGSNDPGLAERHRELYYDSLDAQMEILAKDQWMVQYFSYRRTFCARGSCRQWSRAGVPFQWDQSHLLDDGSVLTADSLRHANLISSPPSSDISRNSFQPYSGHRSSAISYENTK